MNFSEESRLTFSRGGSSWADSSEERAEEVSACLGSDSFVTREEFGYGMKQSALCSHSRRNISVLCSHSESYLSWKRCIPSLVFTTGSWARAGNARLTSCVWLASA